MTSLDPAEFDDWPLDEPPDDGWLPDDCDPGDYRVDAEPIVGVPVGLLGSAIELLDLCDEMFNRASSSALDTLLATVLGRYQRPADTGCVRWFLDGVASTAQRLYGLLEDEGIVVEPELHGRHGLLYRP